MESLGLKGPRVFEAPASTFDRIAENPGLAWELLDRAYEAKDDLGEDWWKVAEEAYGFAYACNHADIDPSCQEFLSKEAQADLLRGKLPEKGLVRMCSDCWKAYGRGTARRSN